jgi:ferredoxin-NADP reductase
MVEHIPYKVHHVVQETHDVKTIHIEPKDPGIHVPSFKPGQFINIALELPTTPPRMLARPYSMCSAPTDYPYLSLTFKVVEKELSFSKLLAKLKPGDSVGVNGPFGLFTFDENVHKDVVMIAGGVGVTPFRSIIRYAAAKKLPNKLTLLFTNKTHEDIIYRSEFAEMEKNNPNFRCICTITREGAEKAEGIETGRFDAARILAACGGSIGGKHFMLCGSTPFVQAFRQLLTEMGVPKERILFELFGNSV